MSHGPECKGTYGVLCLNCGERVDVDEAGKQIDLAAKVDELKKLLEYAVENERERCAKLAESELCSCKEEDLHDGCCAACGKRIAGAIRTRHPKT
jgi:hypothetical protein